MEKLNTENQPELNMELSEVPDHFEALIVLAKGWRDYFSTHDDLKPLKLSVESKMNALGAGEMLRNNIVDKVIISGGKTAGQEKESEAKAIFDFIEKEYPEIRKTSVILEEESIDTVENAKIIAELLKKNNISGPVALMAIGYQLDRAKTLFESQGVSVKGFPSESQLISRNSHYKKFLEDYNKSLKVRLHQVKESIMRGLLYFDPEGKIPALLTHKQRHSAERKPTDLKK